MGQQSPSLIIEGAHESTVSLSAFHILFESPEKGGISIGNLKLESAALNGAP
jgi:hypothetical protein